MPIIRTRSAFRKATGLPWLSALLTSTALLFNSAGTHAQGREATVTEPDGMSTHHYDTPITSGLSTTDKIQRAATVRQTYSHNNNFWINQATIGLNTDHDHDGHYSSFTLTIDIDTYLASSAVYAVLYLSLQDNNWSEYAVSSNFTVRGSGPYDAYTIEANLDSGYPSGYYDQYIEIYDAYSNELLLGHGPNNSYTLHSLPFESSYHDQRFLLSSDLRLDFSGAGTLGLPLLLPLICAWSYRRLRYWHW